MKKQVIVVGLGRFGHSIAMELYQSGHDVLAIDLDEKKVQDTLGQVTYAVKGDATSETLLKELGAQNFDVAIVAIGSDIQSSILVTVLLKSLNIPFIIARSTTELHGNTLNRIGADKVVHPEEETGKRLAHVEFQSGIVDYMDISSDYGVTKMRPTDKMIDHTLEESGISGPRDKYGIAVLAIRRGRECILVPSKEEIIQPGDMLIVAGTAESLGKLHAPDQNNNDKEIK
ncbi:TrkA family potassium uptake protein [SAR202 cluster bacterium AC-409-J13_OGT_754m]|nr:TrkA family potassium uptake protein [SAR202 cluster bacterium AC-409-J13_OGT_754m]